MTVIHVESWGAPASPPAELPQGGGELVQGEFRELDKLDKRLAQLAEYPDVADYEIGALTLSSDGIVMCIIELVFAGEDCDPVWVRRATLDADKVARWLLLRRGQRSRIKERIVQVRCAHDFDKRRCRKCSAPKPVKNPTCGSRPRSWTAKHSRFARPPVCRRRRGHDGDCPWMDDPGSSDRLLPNPLTP